MHITKLWPFETCNLVSERAVCGGKGIMALNLLLSLQKAIKTKMALKVKQLRFRPTSAWYSRSIHFQISSAAMEKCYTTVQLTCNAD